MKQTFKGSGKDRPSYNKLVKGYMGFLTGTGKSLATISSYKGDLSLLESFLQEKKKDFYGLSARDFSSYQAWLEKQGLKTNTRRRKILSAKALVRYAVSRKKLSPSAVQFVKAPDRLERLPWIPVPAEWAKIKAQLNPKTKLGLRNALIVQLLAETGITVAELCELRWEQVSGDLVEVEGKKPRRLKISKISASWLKSWRAGNSGKFLFPGYNRHGATSEKMTPRGVELYFRVLSLKCGFPLLKPKTLRHFAIATWLRSNTADDEIHRRLGVHPNYSLDAYRKHLQSR